MTLDCLELNLHFCAGAWSGSCEFGDSRHFICYKLPTSFPGMLLDFVVMSTCELLSCLLSEFVFRCWVVFRTLGDDRLWGQGTRWSGCRSNWLHHSIVSAYENIGDCLVWKCVCIGLYFSDSSSFVAGTGRGCKAAVTARHHSFTKYWKLLQAGVGAGITFIAYRLQIDSLKFCLFVAVFQSLKSRVRFPADTIPGWLWMKLEYLQSGSSIYYDLMSLLLSLRCRLERHLLFLQAQPQGVCLQ